MTEPIIRIENLHHTYTGASSVEALRGIDLTIRSGEHVAIVGANGSGKSTLARHLNGLLLPTRGDVWIENANTRDPKSLRDIRATVQMVFQHPDSQLVATVVEEDVVFGPENFGVPESELPQRVRAALEQVGMWGHRQRAPHLLSAGQKQRVAIAGAMAVRPRVLVLDEATAMLDPAGRAAVLDVLRELHWQGTTIITITHEMEEAAQAERVIVLNQGRIVMDGSPHGVFARADELRALALDVPPIAALALRLRLPVCLTTEEFCAALTVRGQRIGLPLTPRADDYGERGDPIVQIEQLSHAYLRGLPLETRALDRVDLNISSGAALGLIGSTGSGKSTLMQHFNGLIRPQSGHVMVGQSDLANPATDVRAVRRMVGLLFQQPEDQLFEQYVGDDVAFGPRQFGLSKDEVRERVRWAMESVGLGFDAFKDRLTNMLSGGERRRAALAGVFALRPQVLVADEPTAGLDPQARADVLQVFRRLHVGGTTLVLTSHRMDDIAALCQRVTALDGGRVIASGTRREIFSQPDFLHAYGLDVPPAARLAQQLRAQGWQVPDGVLFADELVAALGGNGDG
jgi:energy-coupling factor transport system ATP-binding protein